MKRNGFTMVELIFVIIIIGILSVAAIPKFGDIKDRAKVATEYSALSSLDGAITGLLEFQQEDYENVLVNWNNSDVIQVGSAAYLAANDPETSGGVLKRLVKKGEDLKIIGFVEVGTASSAGVYDDVYLIKGTASNVATGTDERDDSINGGNGKPDKNDVWVFNASPSDVTVNYHDGKAPQTKTLATGDLVLIDNGEKMDYTATVGTSGTGEKGKIEIIGTITNGATGAVAITPIVH